MSKDNEYRPLENKHWKVDWEARIIYMSSKITNKDLIDMFNYITTEEGLSRMIEDGPHAEWTILTFKIN